MHTSQLTQFLPERNAMISDPVVCLLDGCSCWTNATSRTWRRSRPLAVPTWQLLVSPQTGRSVSPFYLLFIFFSLTVPPSILKLSFTVLLPLNYSFLSPPSLPISAPSVLFLFLPFFSPPTPAPPPAVQECEDSWHHLSELVLFALSMQETLTHINADTGNNFQLRAGRREGKKKKQSGKHQVSFDAFSSTN